MRTILSESLLLSMTSRPDSKSASRRAGGLFGGVTLDQNPEAGSAFPRGPWGKLGLGSGLILGGTVGESAECGHLQDKSRTSSLGRKLMTLKRGSLAFFGALTARGPPGPGGRRELDGLKKRKCGGTFYP